MNSPLMEVNAFRNLDDLLARRNLIDSADKGYLATHYLVEYGIRTLIGPGRYSEGTIVRFDLFANNNYPLSEPACWVVDSPIPWSPHFLEGHEICIGPIWSRAEGKILLGELIIHVAKLLNFEEPPYEDPNYGGWQPDAVEYWETKLNRQPISRLVYPQIPRRVPQVNEPPPPSRVVVFRHTIEPPAPNIRIRPSDSTEFAQSVIRLRPE
jgi:hypothetical protein